jgi:hypothetical protein
MGLMKKIFRRADGSIAADEPQSDENDKEANHSKSPRDTRRELVQVILRDTMRKHSIPSDWIECRILSVQTQQKPGMHVQFVVRQGDEQLLDYVHAFQESFWEVVLQFEPQAREWLFSVTWQFLGKSVRGFASRPSPTAARVESRAVGEPEAGDTQPQYEDEDDLASDLQALYAIRDAAISQRKDATAGGAV